MRKTLKKTVFLASLFLGAAQASTNMNYAPKDEPVLWTWADWLPAIASVESLSGFLTNSYLGPKYGRGHYHVSEIALLNSKWRHWPKWNWIKPNDLYREPVCRMVAIDTLECLDVYYSDRTNKIDHVLSGYCQGAWATDQNGLLMDYVNKVKQAKGKLP